MNVLENLGTFWWVLGGCSVSYLAGFRLFSKVLEGLAVEGNGKLSCSDLKKTYMFKPLAGLKKIGQAASFGATGEKLERHIVIHC